MLTYFTIDKTKITYIRTVKTQIVEKYLWLNLTTLLAVLE
jgi:hypothetical protein